MALTKEEKNSVLKDYGLHEGDTGSPAVQIALLTKTIEKLTEHLKTNKKDVHSRRGLLQMVGRRRRLAEYLKETDAAQLEKLTKMLNL